MKRPRVDVNLEELDQIIERGTHAPLSASESEKLENWSCMHWRQCCRSRASTEKTEDALGQPEPTQPKAKPEKQSGHGRNGAGSYTGAKKVVVPHPSLHAGDPCPGCEKGKVYPQKEPRMLVRMVGQAPLAATVYELDRLRCNLCGQKWCSPRRKPEGNRPGKIRRDHMAAMIALLKYGSGMPLLSFPKNWSSCWGFCCRPPRNGKSWKKQPKVIKAARRTDSSRPRKAKCCTTTTPACGRCISRASRPAIGTGVFTSGIVRLSTPTRTQDRLVLHRPPASRAKNLRDVLQHRTADLARPLQMCDALSRNTPKLADGAQILLANCLAHGRRQFVEVAANFPEPCRYVLETLGEVYKYDAQADSFFTRPERGLVEVACWAHSRRHFHQALDTDSARMGAVLAHIALLYKIEKHARRSGISGQDLRLLREQASRPALERLHQYLNKIRDEVLPKSEAGQAVAYALKNWTALTRYLEDGDLSIDNNHTERSLRGIAVGRRNWTFVGSDRGGKTMAVLRSFVASCELAKVDPFAWFQDVLTRIGECSIQQLDDLLPHNWAAARR